MARVVITEFMDPSSASILESEFGAMYDPELVADRQKLLAVMGDVHALVVRNRTLVDAALLDAAPQLRVVARLGVGLDNIDVTECQARGVEVAPATGANAVAVAEYVIAALLALVRGVFGSTDDMTRGLWPRSSLRGGELAGKTLGLIGFGGIAREVARRAEALGMTLIAHDPYLSLDDPVWSGVGQVTLAQLLERADAVSIHVPLTETTHHLIGAEQVEAMREGAVLVNTARGGVVDELAVVSALREGHLGGAALDVFEVEPVDASYGSRFEEVPNLILTPHVAGITVESEERIGDMTVATVRRHLAGDS